MPIRQTTKDGKPAYQYGTTGKKYTFNPNDEQSKKELKKKLNDKDLLHTLFSFTNLEAYISFTITTLPINFCFLFLVNLFNFIIIPLFLY